jgi:hypothetical protein
MDNNPVVTIVLLVLGGIMGVWGFLRLAAPTLLVNYPTLIVSHAVKFIPALAVLLGGQTTIQQEPVRKPGDHLPSQNQAPANTVGGTGYLVVAASTSSESFRIVDADEMKAHFTIPTKPKRPQP